jgi:hypothetical protein
MQAFGAIFCGLAAIQLAIYVLSSLQTLAMRKRQIHLSLEHLQEQIRATRALRNQREQSRLCWNGVRKFEVASKIVEANNICSFHLVPHDRKPLPLFRPGQFLTFRLRPEDSEKPVVRCYSISSSPNPDYYRVTIKRVPSPPGSDSIPPGMVSNYFHDHVNEGDILDVEAPRGKFCIEPTLQRPLVLIAGGVGITPFVSMIHAIAETETPRETVLLYGIHTTEDEAFRDEIQSHEGKVENFSAYICYSEANGTGQPESDGKIIPKYQHQKITPDLLKKVLRTSNYDFYLCGPPPMMDSLIAGLQDWGVPKNQIFTEAFGPATGKAVRRIQMAEPDDAQSGESKPVPSDKPFRVQFSKSCKSTVWKNSEASLLELARDLDVTIESGCESGHCGTCVVAIKSGSVICTNEQGAETEEGTCLTCISVPAGDLVLDA